MDKYSCVNKGGTFTFDAAIPAWSFHSGDRAEVRNMDVAIEINGSLNSCLRHITSTMESTGLNDAHGAYTQIAITSRLDQPSVQLEVLFRVYLEAAFLTITVQILNEAPDSSVTLGKCKLLYSSESTDSSIMMGEHPSRTKVLCQSAWVINNSVQVISSESGVHTSKTAGLLYNPESGAALNCSFLTFDRADTELVYTYKSEADSIALEAVCNFDGYELVPGQLMSSETAYLELAANPFTSLEDWASRVSEHYKPKFAARPNLGWVGGWTWRDGFSQETYEEIVLENAAALNQKLGGFGIKNIWTSIGNLKDMLPGNWTEQNLEAFPHGWEWLIQKLEQNGQKLGFWIAPFWIPNKGSDLFEEHKDNLLKKDGEYIFNNYKSPYGKSGTLPKEERVGFYSLDGSHPRTQQFLRKVFEYYNKIGIRFFMIDFLYAGSGTTPGHFPYDEYYDRTKIKGPEVYREALKIIREAAGEETYLLSSTGTTFQNVGCVDAVRVGPDIGEGRPLIETMAEYPATYTIHGWNLINTVASSMAYTYFTDRKLYYNDGFNVLTVGKPIPLEEARATVSMFGLSSGPVVLGDDIATISDERLALIKKCLPQYTKMARPVDLFTAAAPDPPRIFNLHVKKPWEDWNVVGVLNAGALPMSVALSLGDLGLDDAETPYTVFDFWNEMYMGEVVGSMKIEVPAYSVKVLRISKARNHPWLLSTDMHITQGGVEIEQLEWNGDKGILKGVCTRPAGEQGNLYFRLPPGWKPVIYDGLNVAKIRSDNMVIAMKRLAFNVETVTWRVDFERTAEFKAGNYAGL